MVWLGFGLGWMGYAVGLYGYVLITGYNLTLAQLISPTGYYTGPWAEEATGRRR